jgi:hypothetical protein
VAATVGEVLRGAAAIRPQPDDHDRQRNGGVAAYLNWLAD